jgi:hypothetical protein
MLALESLAAIVTILGGIVAALFWMYGRMVALRRENDHLQKCLYAMKTAPNQPANADYLVDGEGSRLCIRCYHTSQSRWKLLREANGWRCPVCGNESRHETPTDMGVKRKS